MKFYKITKSLISFVCVFALLVSLLTVPVVAADGKTVTATTSTSLNKGASGTFYVYIDSTESLAALDVSVHFDPSKIKVNSVYNSISCVLYDNAKNTDNVQFSYIFDGEGSTSETRLFYFSYQVLSNADVGDTYFDISIGEAYDNSLNDVLVSGSRCKLSITESVTSKSCTVSSSSTVSTSVQQQFSLSYRFSTYQIASGSAVITYDPELFEVVDVTCGEFLSDKLFDVNTTLKGSVYVSFVGTQYNTKYDFLTVKFKTIKNVDESSKITFKATELCDLDLNSISCPNYETTANISFDDKYIGDAPKMAVNVTYDVLTNKITAEIKLDENSRLGAGDFILSFDPELITYSSYAKGFSPTFFNINDKEVETGKFKFSIISLSDITTAENIIKVVFDAKHICGESLIKFGLSGSTVVDSMVNSIMLNCIGTTITMSQSHIAGDWIVNVAPTCTANGSKHKECTVCGVTLSTESIDMLGHDEIAHEAKTPTCTEIGWDEYVTCSRCNYTTYGEISATRHTASEWIIDTNSTCTTNGSKHKECTVCQEILSTERIDALSHDEITHEAQSPTCTEIGWDEYVTCSRCDYTTYEEISATGIHNHIAVTTLPTCTEQGFTTYTCDMCNDSYIDDCVKENGHSYDNSCDTNCNVCGETRNITHAYGDWIIDENPTCTVAGSKHKVCSVCNATVTESIDATGIHNYVGVITKPTCTADGFTTYTCSVCGDSYIDDYTDAIGHTYDDDFDNTCNTCGFIRTAKLYGDVNSDGLVNNRDAALLMQYINNWNITIDLDAADMNHDGKINNKDYVYLMRKINGWDVVLK